MKKRPLHQQSLGPHGPSGPARPARLLTAASRLKEKQQRTVRPALEHPRDYVLLTIRQLAKRLKTDPATMLRIERGMGFRGHRKFQEFLHELSIVQATSLDTMQSSTSSDSDVLAQVRESLDRDLKNLALLRRTLDSKRLRRLVERIFRAKRILILGGDLAESLVLFLQYHLTILGFNVMAGTGAGSSLHAARTTGVDDLVVAISFRRGLRQTVEALKRAHANRAYCVGITDTRLSPVADFADEVFLTSVECPSFGASYVSPLALLNALILACANFQRSRTLSFVREVGEEQQTGFRWYPL